MVTVIKSKKHNALVFNKTVSKKDGKTYGQFLVQETVKSINGFFKVSKRTAIVPISEDSFNDIYEGMSIGGKIVREERFTPFYENQPCKAYPAEHPKAGEPVLVDGQKVWFKDSHTPDMTAEDKLVISSVAKPAEVVSNGLKTPAEGVA